MKKYCLLLLLLIGISLYCWSQARAVERVAEHFSERTAKEAALDIAKRQTYKELLREGIERTGRKFTGEALGRQVAKRAIREELLKKMEKEGVESFLEYGSKKALMTLERTGSSAIKKRMLADEAENATKKSAYHLAIEKNSRLEYKFINIPTKVKETYLNSRIKKCLLYKKLLEIWSKGPIKLSDKELAYLLENPKALRNYIEIYTGDKKNFQEFFIRLAMNGNSQQVKMLIANSEIKKFINKSIRKGGVHEWLLTSNFEDFLTNPKWGKDGPFLALSLTELVQKTENIIFKTGGGHPSSSRLNSAASVAFHNGLAEVINKCKTKEEVFVAVKKYAKENLDAEAYKEFTEIFSDVFKKA